jgi:hypothetical protein
LKGSVRGIILRYYTGTLPEGLSNTTKDLSTWVYLVDNTSIMDLTEIGCESVGLDSNWAGGGPVTRSTQPDNDPLGCRLHRASDHKLFKKSVEVLSCVKSKWIGT